jgi:hypothetical protein
MATPRSSVLLGRTMLDHAQKMTKARGFEEYCKAYKKRCLLFTCGDNKGAMDYRIPEWEGLGMGGARGCPMMVNRDTRGDRGTAQGLE